MKQGVDSRESYLLRQAKQGDMRSVIQLLEPSYQRIYTYAYLLCGTVQDAEEVVHAGLHAAIDAISSLRGNIEAFVLSHVREFAFRRVRQQGHRPPGNEVLLALSAAMERRDEGEIASNLIEALDLLSIEEREAFVLVAVLNYSPVLSQEITGVRPSVVQSRLTRACQRMSSAHFI